MLLTMSPHQFKLTVQYFYDGPEPSQNPFQKFFEIAHASVLRGGTGAGPENAQEKKSDHGDPNLSCFDFNYGIHDNTILGVVEPDPFQDAPHAPVLGGGARAGQENAQINKARHGNPNLSYFDFDHGISGIHDNTIFDVVKPNPFQDIPHAPVLGSGARAGQENAQENKARHGDPSDNAILDVVKPHLFSEFGRKNFEIHNIDVGKLGSSPAVLNGYVVVIVRCSHFHVLCSSGRWGEEELFSNSNNISAGTKKLLAKVMSCAKSYQ